MSDIERRDERNVHPVSAPAPAPPPPPGEEDYGRLGERRTRRMRMVAWVTIISLILVGGGSTVLSLLLG